ncbi:MAG: SIMPL domain-containing protein [Burkholderiales bacterium]|nr:SIMPL domain-containing protein [Burkholderiales bacterium]
MMKKGALLLMVLTIFGSVLAGTLPNFPFIHATGEASIHLPATMAEIDFELTELTPEPQLTIDTIVADSKEVFEFLVSQQIAEGDIDAADIKRFISPIEYQDRDENAKRYRLMRNFHVVVRDMKQWNAIVSGLLQKAYLGNFSVRFGRDDLPQIQHDLVMRAAADAKQNAQRLAQGFSVRLGNAGAISQAPIKSIASLIGLDGETKYESTFVEVKPQTRDFSMPAYLKYQQTVNVVFKIKG